MAGITVQLYAGLDRESSKVEASGEVIHTITDEERNKFQLQDKDLKSAVKAYFDKSPDDVFLHPPTPWDKDDSVMRLWRPVQTTLSVLSAQIIEITSEPVVIAENVFTNSSDLPGIFTAGVSDSVTDTVESNWSETFGFEVTQTIKYGVSVLGSGGGGETSFSFESVFGSGGSESKSVTVGSQQDVAVELQPGESVVARLTASRGKMKVRIRYNVSVNGDVLANYDPKYKDHHFWFLNVNSVMQSVKYRQSYTMDEEIEIGYFSKAHTILLNETAKAALSKSPDAAAVPAESSQT